MTIVFVFKNGFVFEMKCKSFKTTRSALGELTNIKVDGIAENQFLHIDFSEVQCIYRKMSDEVAE